MLHGRPKFAGKPVRFRGKQLRAQNMQPINSPAASNRTFVTGVSASAFFYTSPYFSMCHLVKIPIRRVKKLSV